MCGITGFIDFNKQCCEADLLLQTKTLTHRGPDGNNIYFEEKNKLNIGFGHTRLSIIDLSNAASQPMLTDDCVVVFNGEIYNYNEIKSELLQLNYKFKTDSDTEVIIKAYKQWGIFCIEKFVGMFAIALYDKKINKVFFIRDRVGVKPFYYYYKNNMFVFGSELKSIIYNRHFYKVINKNVVSDFLQFGCITTEESIYKDCYKLKPGHFIEFDLNNNKLNTVQYWNVLNYYSNPKLVMHYNDAKNETEKLLVTACKYRMVADVPVGIFLSGGYDSSTVAGILQKNFSKQLNTFTIGVPDIGLNEAPYAKSIAEHLQTNHTELYCTEQDVLQLIEQLPYYYDEPFADSSAIPTMLVSNLAKQQVKVALSADGGDELFAGYTRYDYLMRYRKKLQNTPGFLKKSAYNILKNINPNYIPLLNKKYNFYNRYTKAVDALKNSNKEDLFLQMVQIINYEKANKFLIEKNFKNEKSIINILNELDYYLANDFINYLPNDILQKVDRATMSCGLEGREPLLDHKLIEFVTQLPDDYKLYKGIKKRILKDISKNYIPNDLLNRPKMGFAIPIYKWLPGLLKKYQDLFSNEFIFKQNIFVFNELSSLITEFNKGKKENATLIWHFLMFQLWYTKWMQN